MRKLISMSLLVTIVITSFAFKGPKQKQETTYSIDITKTTASWLGKKVTGQHEGNISISKGKVNTDGKNITGGTVEFDMNSITCTDLKDKNYNDKLVGHLKSADFFSVEKFPTATFEITKVSLLNKSYNVTGKLTIKGITNEISFPAVIKMDEKTMTVVAKITVNRTKFDIKYGSASFFDTIGDKAISDDFDLNVNVVAGVN